MGFVVLTLGAGIDFSHIYLVRNELQAEIDEIALRAARELDGTAAGFERSRRTALWEPGPDRDAFFAFSTDRLVSIGMEYSQSLDQPWKANPENGRGYRFVQVTASAEVRLFFLPMLPAAKTKQTVVVRAVAGQHRAETDDARHLAYATVAEDGSDADFGFVPGEMRPLILLRDGPCEQALAARFRHDTDTISRTYQQYSISGNGQRVVFAAVTRLERASTAAGYGTFLIQPGIVEGGPCQAAYVGNAPVRNAARNGAGGPGLYEVRLHQ